MSGRTFVGISYTVKFKLDDKDIFKKYGVLLRICICL